MRASYPNISNIDRANINLDYSFAGSAELRPIKVFDDGNKTFFQFAKKTPAIFGVNSDYTETLKNFRKEGEYVVVDGVSSQFTLRDGNVHTCIFNLGKPDYGAPDPFVEAPVKDAKAVKRRRSGNK
jgi:type IV secretion system protein VirB9